MDDRGGLVWRTSSKSSGGNCVAVASGGEVTHVRDSKDPTGPALTFHAAAFRDFIAYIKDADPSRR
ncbi:DUF397 domain-containing protein [Dactylosporangium sp. NPDC049525]|uniref:DUF397 domain-containing protein n=1 Tax=Dactylosporangium sp. NPDC049525 TaxID=3154730 RepID=UPI003447B7DE